MAADEYGSDQMKKLLRREMRTKAASFFQQTGSGLPLTDESCDSMVLSLPEWKEAGTVLMYSAIPGEISLDRLMDLALQQGKKVVLPLALSPDGEGSVLILKEYAPGKLVSGYKGIPEPAADAPEVAPSQIDFALIPGLAFDADCRRLGRGKGFYDRTLPLLECPCAGISHSWQLVERVPSDEWDIALDLIVLPDRVIRRIR